MIKRIVLLLCLIAAQYSIGQQEPTYTHYNFNPLTINPAVAGSKEMLSAIAISRTRWLKFPGAPKTQNLSLHSLLRSKSLGGGLSFLNDSKGPTRFTGVDADIAYRLPFKEGVLAFGIKAGVRFLTNRLNSEIVTSEQGDAAFQSDVTFRPLVNFGIGLYYTRNDFYAGISAPKLLENNLNTNTITGNSTTERNYYLMIGHAFDLNPDKTIQLKPSMMVKITGSSLVQMDANFLFYFEDNIWIGPMFRSTNDIGFLAGLNINTQLKLSYALDWSFGNKTATYNNGTHEIMVGYDFIFDKKQGVVSPRHF